MRTLIILLYIILTTPFALARQILIIHTNDLHSYFEHYPRVMTKIKELRNEAQMKGIDVLQVDAGDWGDGTSYYLSNEGADSIRALELFGVEVAAIGNHDHMIGGKVLADQIKRANTNIDFVSANLRPTADMNLGDVVSPYVDLDKGGVKIRIVGLTTSSNLYEYSMRPGWIASPYAVGENEARKGKNAGREVVIALSHLGVIEDAFLAQHSRSIDLIIGGHSHTKLLTPLKKVNQRGKIVPIVQAWSHGLAVGSLLIDVSKRGQVKVMKYKLHIIKDSLPEDQEMASFVAQAQIKKNESLQMDWNEIIGETKIPITGSRNGDTSWKNSCWGSHMARATRLAVNADIGIHIPAFAGKSKPAGPVRFGDIVDNFPHIRKFGDPGWEIATVMLPGWKIRPFMFLLSRIGYGANFSGLGYKSLNDLNAKAIYQVAIPAEMAYAIKGSLPLLRSYLTGLEFTNVYLWPAVTEYIRENSPLKC